VIDLRLLAILRPPADTPSWESTVEIE